MYICHTCVKHFGMANIKKKLTKYLLASLSLSHYKPSTQHREITNSNLGQDTSYPGYGSVSMFSLWSQ